MRKSISILSIAVLMAITSNAYASCPTSPSGPSCAGGLCWYNYTPDSNCWYVDGAESTNEACLSPAFRFPHGALISYSVTIGPNDPVTGSFSFAAHVEFSDSSHSSSNEIQGWSGVEHNGVTTYNLLWSHKGSDGDLSCSTLYGNFSAVRGDTITVWIQASNPGSATIMASNMFLYTWY